MPLNLYIKKQDNQLKLSGTDSIEAFAKMEEGKVYKAELKQRRSNPHNNLFHAVINKAYKNWPENNHFQPNDKDHLKSWLLCKAGYRTTDTFEFSERTNPEMVAEFVARLFARKDKPVFFRTYKNMFVADTPKKTRFHKMEQDVFNEVSVAVSDVLKAETGLSFDQYKKELEARHAA